MTVIPACFLAGIQVLPGRKPGPRPKTCRGDDSLDDLIFGEQVGNLGDHVGLSFLAAQTQVA